MTYTTKTYGQNPVAPQRFCKVHPDCSSATLPKELSLDDLVQRNGQWREYAEMLASDKHENIPAFSWELGRVFRGIDFQGKRVLDIGSGKGMMTIYAALRGAERVVSMEPELEGSGSQVAQLQRDRIAKLELKNIDLISNDFNNWRPADKEFDVILSFASINHLHETPHHAMRHQETFSRFKGIAGQIREMMSDGGVAVIADACRYGFFYFTKPLGLRRPWQWSQKVTIDWRIHQNPQVWRNIFESAGFSNTDVIYPLPYNLRKLGVLASNKISNFFLESKFILHCHK